MGNELIEKTTGQILMTSSIGNKNAQNPFFLLGDHVQKIIIQKGIKTNSKFKFLQKNFFGKFWTKLFFEDF